MYNSYQKKMLDYCKKQKATPGRVNLFSGQTIPCVKRIRNHFKCSAWELWSKAAILNLGVPTPIGVARLFLGVTKSLWKNLNAQN